MALTPEDAVGQYARVTLVTDLKVEGVIFTYNPDQGLLVIIENISSDLTNLKVLRTCYIKEFEIDKEANAELPGRLEAYSQLPSMSAGRSEKTIFKYADEKVKAGKEAYNKYLSNLPSDISIGAVTALLKIARVYPGVSWDNSNRSIRVSGDVIVVGDPDWSAPRAKMVEGTKNDSTLLTSVKTLLAK